jgi:DNA (cytosine-5)-methyltransferase 1
MTHGSLFSGIGGFDLAAEWMGWENKFHCEWNEFGQRVLHHYWPNAELFTDITKSDFTKYANTIDVLTGGFPCQPYSSAGKRLGKEDERHLWPEMCRAIREIAPRYVVGENVRGLTNWNGGLVFDEVCADLENIGYQVAPFIIPASAVNAPHQRERIWFVAYANYSGTDNGMRDKRAWKKKDNQRERQSFIEHRANGIDGNATDSDSNGFNQCDCEHEKHSGETGFDAFNDVNKNDERWDVANSSSPQSQSVSESKPKWNRQNGKTRIIANTDEERLQCARESTELGGIRLSQCDTQNYKSNWKNFPTQSPVCSGDDGLPTELDGITFSKWRNESIKAYGNAIVPQVVYQIFKSIEAYERTLHTNHMGGHALCNPRMDGETDT